METSVEIQAPASAAWEILTDTRRWPEWGPSLARVESADRHIGPGSTGRVQTAFGRWLPFLITEFTAGRHWRWKVTGIPATGHRVESLGPNRCKVVFEVPLRGAPYLPICHLAAEQIKRILEKEHQGS